MCHGNNNKREEQDKDHESVPEKNVSMSYSLELKGSPLMRTTPSLLGKSAAMLGAGWLADVFRMDSASPSDTSYTEENTHVQLRWAQVFPSSPIPLSRYG